MPVCNVYPEEARPCPSPQRVVWLVWADNCVYGMAASAVLETTLNCSRVQCSVPNMYREGMDDKAVGCTASRELRMEGKLSRIPKCRGCSPFDMKNACIYSYTTAPTLNSFYSYIADRFAVAQPLQTPLVGIPHRIAHVPVREKTSPFPCRHLSESPQASTAFRVVEILRPMLPLGWVAGQEA